MIIKPQSKVLILGANGFIGRNLVQFLLSMDLDVTVLLRSTSDFSYFNSCRIIYGELNNRELCQSIVKNQSIIFNFIGGSSAVESNNKPIESLHKECEPQLSILDACVKTNSKPLIVYTSSRLVYGVPQYLPVDEMHILRPDSLYAIHKVVVERYLDFYQRHYQIPYLNLRIANPYGAGQAPGKKHGIINQFMMNSIQNNTITLFDQCDVLRDYIYIEDLLSIMIKLANNEKTWSSTYNIGCGSGISLLEAAKTICDLTGNQVIKIVKTPDEYRDIETGGYISAITKLKNNIGDFQFILFSNGIKKSLPYYQSLLAKKND